MSPDRPKLLKTWLIEEAARRGLTERALRMQIARGKVALPPHRRVNARVIEILETAPAQPQDVVVGSKWFHNGTRVRITYLAGSSVDAINLDTGGAVVLSRAWFVQHFRPLP